MKYPISLALVALFSVGCGGGFYETEDDRSPWGHHDDDEHDEGRRGRGRRGQHPCFDDAGTENPSDPADAGSAGDPPADAGSSEADAGAPVADGGVSIDAGDDPGPSLTCMDTSECPDGSICEDGMCVACPGGVCAEECAPDGSCPDGSLCGADNLCEACPNGICPCLSDDDCAGDNICDVPSGLCVEPPPPECHELSVEAECLDRTDCQPIYAGMNCTDPNGGECSAGDTDCTCETFAFAVCAARD